MKTNILKWDVRIQTLLVAANMLCIILACIFEKGYLLCIPLLQIPEAIIQLAGSGLHLRLQHKSLGFADWRKIHFYGSLAYLALLLLLNSFHSTALISFIMFFVIPQCIFYAYYFLCVKELLFLQTREFHILR